VGFDKAEELSASGNGKENFFNRVIVPMMAAAAEPENAE
jgi:hypothetical protein